MPRMPPPSASCSRPAGRPRQQARRRGRAAGRRRRPPPARGRRARRRRAARSAPWTQHGRERRAPPRGAPSSVHLPCRRREGRRPTGAGATRTSTVSRREKSTNGRTTTARYAVPGPLDALDPADAEPLRVDAVDAGGHDRVALRDVGRRGQVLQAQRAVAVAERDALASACARSRTATAALRSMMSWTVARVARRAAPRGRRRRPALMTAMSRLTPSPRPLSMVMVRKSGDRLPATTSAPVVVHGSVRAQLEQRPQLAGAGRVGPGLLQLHAQVGVLAGQPRVLGAHAAQRGVSVPDRRGGRRPRRQLASWTSVTTPTTVVRSSDGPAGRRDLRRDEQDVAQHHRDQQGAGSVCRRPARAMRQSMEILRSRLKSASILPAPSTTDDSGSSAIASGSPVSSRRRLSRFLQQRPAARSARCRGRRCRPTARAACARAPRAPRRR